MSNFITFGVDTSTTNIGIAVFEGGNFETTIHLPFKGRYSLDKLKNIVGGFEELVSEYNPGLILIEKPAPVRNSSTLTSLNQVAGGVATVGFMYKATVNFVHNKTIKKLMDVKTKQDSIKKVKQMYSVRDEITDHESDAILVVEAYKIIIEEGKNE